VLTSLTTGPWRSFKYKTSLLLSFLFEFFLSEIYVIVWHIGFYFREKDQSFDNSRDISSSLVSKKVRKKIIKKKIS
jgi:hypothetical protein